MVDAVDMIDVPYATLTPESDNWVPFINIRGVQAGEILWMRNTRIGDLPLQSGIWRVLPGQLPETVDYVFPGEETIHILEGEVTIRIEGEAPIHLKPGDSACFEKGIQSTWTFKMPFHKVFHIS